MPRNDMDGGDRLKTANTKIKIAMNKFNNAIMDSIGCYNIFIANNRKIISNIKIENHVAFNPLFFRTTYLYAMTALLSR